MPWVREDTRKFEVVLRCIFQDAISGWEFSTEDCWKKTTCENLILHPLHILIQGIWAFIFGGLTGWQNITSNLQ